jgi:PPP family 3-phenylpropionic acid transporter
MRTFYFAAFGALGMQAPYFPLWLEAHGFRGSSMSLIAALSPALSAVGPPLIGALSDARGGRGNLLGWVCGISCAAMTALALAEASGLAQLFGVVFACVLPFALCRSPIILLADRIALESNGNFGRRRLWGSIGFLLGATLFGRFWPPQLSRWLPAAVALALGVAFVTSSRLPRAASAPAPVRVPLRQGWSLLRQRRFVLFCCCTAVFSMSHASYDLCASLTFRDLGARSDTIGLLWATGVLAEIGVFALAARLLGAARPERLLIASYALGALRWLAMSVLPNAGLAFLLQPLHGVSFGLVFLSSLRLLGQFARPEAAGGAQGLWMAANAVGGTLGILVYGPLYAAQGGRGVFQLATLLALGATLLGALGLVQRRGDGAR